MTGTKKHLLIEQVLVLFRDIFRLYEVSKNDLIVAFVEHYHVAVCFGCIGKKRLPLDPQGSILLSFAEKNKIVLNYT